MHQKEPRRQASGFFSVGRSVDRFCEEVFFFLFLESGLDVQFFQLLISDYRRCLGERIELVHRASNRDIFARGALEAARRLVTRAPGRYSVAELLTA